MAHVALSDFVVLGKRRSVRVLHQVALTPGPSHKPP